MRTDSTALARVAVDAARELIASQYGPEFLPAAAREHTNKVRNAQEAHEAIRPAGHPFDFPDALRGELSDDEYRIYDLIWKRTVASQMADARVRRTTVLVEGGGATFRAGGKVIDFPGYLRAYVEGSDDPEAELAERDRTLPSLAIGEAVDCRRLEPKSHTTQPPARFTEATLTKELEGRGIGRPSTYATIIDTILARDYVFKRGNALVPTWVAFAVCQLLESHLPALVDYDFTARLEDDLDAISRGEAAQVDYLTGFYFGRDNGARTPGLKQLLADKHEEIDVRQISRIPIGTPGEGPHRETINVRVGRYGPFLEQGDRRASLPDNVAPDEVTVPYALDLLERSSQAEEPLGHCPDTGEPVYLKVGRFGPYVQRGSPDGAEKPKNASLLRGMKPEDVDLATALKLLSLPRTVGQHPESGADIVAYNGRFGPYIKCGEETRSLPAARSPLEVTPEEALELLAQPKTARGRFGRAREPLRVFETSPVTNQKVQLFEGRYGLYVADGVTNASLPKGQTAEGLTQQEALELLAARAALGPSKKSTRRGGRTGPRKRTAATAAVAAHDGDQAPRRAAKKPAKAAPQRKAR
jgi:DNA topoisomerase-1